MIERTQSGRVLHLALNRPEKRNALNNALCRELVKELDDADDNPAIGTVVLSGNGRAFCAGMDLSEASPDPALHERLFTTISRIRKPVIAAIHGAAIAGGTGLAANAHIAIAAPDTIFGLTEIKIALWPVLVFRACTLAMGERRASELSITGRTFTAEEGLTYGLVTEVAEDPLARARQIAAVVSEYSGNAMSSGLEYVNLIRGRAWEEAGTIGRQMRAELMAHPDFREATKAFMKKS